MICSRSSLSTPKQMVASQALLHFQDTYAGQHIGAMSVAGQMGPREPLLRIHAPAGYTAMEGGYAGFAGAKASPPIHGHTLQTAPAFSGYRPSMGVKKERTACGRFAQRLE